MATADKYRPAGSGPARRMSGAPGRFALWELFVLTGLVCITAGFYSWSLHDSEAFVLAIATALAAIVFAIHVLTRLRPLTLSAIAIGILMLGCLLLPSLGTPRQAARRMQCSNHLKQISLALQNYHDVYGSFPPAFVADASGQPVHSWRVLILPFMEQKPLYDKYRFDEPWDGPNNRKLHNQIVNVFCCPSCNDGQPSVETSYVAVVGPQTVWPGKESTTFSDITDGTSSTIMVVETVNSGIHWMEPRDLHVGQMPMAVNPPRGQGFSSVHSNCALAVFVDGHTTALKSETPTGILRALFTIAGGDTIGDY